MASSIVDVMSSLQDPRPIPFIAVGDSGEDLVLVKHALDRLRKETRPITVICIVGPHRYAGLAEPNRVKNLVTS